ncbi:MAG: SprB repeat-containing protein, partial [Bacteroidota bacterium]
MCLAVRTILLGILTLLSATVLAQEICDNGIDDDGDGLVDLQDNDCICVESFTGVTADFEDISCCPQSAAAIDCLADGWTTIDVGTPDLSNTCGYIGGVGLPEVPLPIPSGNGAISMLSIQDSQFPGNEGIARCLDCGFIAGETYEISFFVGFNSNLSWNSGDVEFAIYGKEDCSDIPDQNPLPCIEDDGWVEMATFGVESVINSWVIVNGSFVSPGNYSAIAFKTSCAYITQVGLNQYHFMDDLQISGNFSGPNCGSPSPPADAQVFGDCNSGYFLTTTVSGATQFQWYLDGVAISGATSNPWSINPLTLGEYQVRAILPDGSCTISNPTNFNPDLNSLVFSSNAEQPSCPGEADGSIDLLFNSTNPPFSINWSNGGSGDPLLGLGAGTYTVTVVDGIGCFGEQTIVLEDPEEINSNVDVIQPSMDNGGSVEISTTGGSGPYTYDWDNGLSGPVQSNLDPGTYTITVTDDNGCEEILTIEILEALSASSLVIDETCFDQCDGTVTIMPNGGQSPYSYNWNIGGVTNTQVNLCAGDYDYTVTDINGTEIVGTVSIQPGDLVELDIVQDGIRCDNNETTNLNLTVVSGLAPFTFDWSTGDETEDLIGIGLGNYSVSVVDFNGCEGNANIQVLPIAPLELSSLVTDISCDILEGNILVSVTGGTAPFSFEWDDGQTSDELVNVSSGSYSLTVTDVNGCTTEGTYTVNDSLLLTSSALLTQPVCIDDATGTIDITIDGGTAPFTFSWSTTEETEDINGLVSGDYTVTVSDASNCELVNTFTISPASMVDILSTINDVTCFSGSDGAVTTTTTATLPPLSYNWSNNTNDPDLTDVPAGTYTLTITDAANCSYESTYDIEEPDLFVID